MFSRGGAGPWVGWENCVSGCIQKIHGKWNATAVMLKLQKGNRSISTVLAQKAHAKKHSLGTRRFGQRTHRNSYAAPCASQLFGLEGRSDSLSTTLFLKSNDVGILCSHVRTAPLCLHSPVCLFLSYVSCGPKCRPALKPSLCLCEPSFTIKYSQCSHPDTRWA